MSHFSDDIKLFGRHFIVGLSGTTISSRERDLLRDLHPAGIILFRQNVDMTRGNEWVSPFRDLIERARDYAKRDRFLVSIDHEGGKVHRLAPPTTQFPAAALWKNKSGEIGAAMGRELRGLGVNLSYAPVLDIHSEPKNPVIGQRAFGTTPEVVAEAGKEFFLALEAEGVLACGKHFPGHGDTTKDSHVELPVLGISREKLEARELLPFRALIDAGLEAIMTAHVLYPEIDPEFPATLSKKIIDGILRTDLRFRGVVISDALDMGAMTKLSGTNVGKAVLDAGGDFLLVAKPLPGRKESPYPVEHGCEMAFELLSAASDGELDEQRLSKSHHRITAFLRRIEKLKPGSVASIGASSHSILKKSLEV